MKDNIGIKIVDKEDDIVLKLLKEAQKLMFPIELGLYGGGQKEREYCHKSNFPINIHFNHIEYSLGDLVEKNEDLFFQEVEIAKYIGADYGVHHLAKYPVARNIGYYDALIKDVLKRVFYVDKLAAKVNFPVYLENTFESVMFYRDIFRDLKDKTKYLHFCYDIGHAKVWSGDSFKTWIEFLEELKEWGFRLHFHLHANRGLIDEHLSLLEAKKMCFDGNDGVFSDKSYEQMYKEIFRKFPQSRMIFEVKPKLAMDNRDDMLNILQN